MKRILVVGSMNMDLVFGVENLPQKGQTIFGNRFETHHGGKGANQAYVIGKLHGNVEMIGVVGKDAYGSELIAGLKEIGIDTSHIGLSSKPTGTANIIVDANGDNTIVVTPGANFDYSPEFIKTIKQAIDQCDYLVLQFEIPYEVVKELAIYAHTKNKQVILNPAPARKIDNELLDSVDYLIPNETELGVISGLYFKPNVKDATSAAQRFIYGTKVKNLIVTLGKEGSVWINQSEDAVVIPAKKVKAVDSTAAGDSYLGAFVYGMANGQSVPDSLDFAAKVSAVVVTRPGAQSSIPSLEEVQNFKFDK